MEFAKYPAQPTCPALDVCRQAGNLEKLLSLSWLYLYLWPPGWKPGKTFVFILSLSLSLAARLETWKTFSFCFFIKSRASPGLSLSWLPRLSSADQHSCDTSVYMYLQFSYSSSMHCKAVTQIHLTSQDVLRSFQILILITS